MTSFRRKVANILERITGARIVSPVELGTSYGAEHLRRLIAEFSVDCVFDVGANAGQYARLLRTRANYIGPIVSFEPVPSLVHQLQSAASSNDNWFIRQVALDQTAGRARFAVTQDAQFSSLRNVSALGESIFPRHVANIDYIDVETSTLALEFPRWRDAIEFRRPFLKIDTQGNDLAVAAGAGDLLRNFVAIQAELAIHKLYDNTPDIAEAISFFRDQGFEPSAFTPNNEGTFPMLLETDCIFINRAYAGGIGPKCTIDGTRGACGSMVERETAG